MRIPLEELGVRLNRVQTGLAEAGLDGALIVQTVDLYYLTGTAQQGHLLLPACGDPVLLVRRDPDRARAESALPRVQPLTSLRELPPALEALGLGSGARLGLELDVLPVSVYRRYAELLPGAELLDCSSILRRARSVKTPYEAERLRRAAALSLRALTEATRALRPGVSEAEIASVIVACFVREGHPGLLRMRGLNQEMPCAHVFSGPDAGVASYADAPFGGRGQGPAVPQGASMRPIGSGEAVVIDLGAMNDGYITDQTRTLSLGPLPADLARAYEACRLIRGELVQATKPGVQAGALYDLARARAADLGYADSFLGAAPMQVGFVGHGIGLEVDEIPVLGRGSAEVLVAGNVLAIEPKIRLTGRGAVGIEDTYLVTDTGLEQLTLGDEGVWQR